MKSTWCAAGGGSAPEGLDQLDSAPGAPAVLIGFQRPRAPLLIWSPHGDNARLQEIGSPGRSASPALNSGLQRAQIESRINAKIHPEFTHTSAGACGSVPGAESRVGRSFPARGSCCAPALGIAPRSFRARARAWSHSVGSCPQRLRTMARPTSRPRCRAKSRGEHSAEDPGVARSWGPRAGRARSKPRRRGELSSPARSLETVTRRWGRRGPGRGGSALGLETLREPRAWRPACGSLSPTPTSVGLRRIPGHRPPSSRRRSGPCHPVNPLPSPGALT